jgi:TusA-related sulfurtransferase
MEVGPLPADKTLDARDLVCPMPLLKTRQALRGLLPGETLLVLATDPGSCRDIPAYLGQSPHQLVQQHEQQGEYQFLIAAGEES